MIKKRYIMDRYNSCLREGKYGSYQKKYEWGVAVRSSGSSGGCSREDVCLLYTSWGQSWIIWVVAGVMFPAIVAITNAFDKKSK